MKKKFRKLLSEKCKDMGLTDKALDDLVEIGAEGLADDASDEDIAAKVDSLVPYAKAMQGEITRKTQRPKPQSKKPQSNDEGEDEGGNEDEAPEWFKPFQKKLTDLETENAALKAEKAKTTRQAEISAKAKKLGIPDYLMKRVSFAEDADLDKELADYKQELVTNNLMPKEQPRNGHLIPLACPRSRRMKREVARRQWKPTPRLGPKVFPTSNSSESFTP